MAGTLTINVKLNNPGACAGPCSLYSNADSYTIPLATGISITVLTSPVGYNIDVPDGGLLSPTVLRVVNDHPSCNQNYIDIPIQF